MSVFQSEKTIYLQILVPRSSAKSFLFHVGNLKIMEFTDLQYNIPLSERRFSQNISCINDLEQKLERIIEISKSTSLRQKFNEKNNLIVLRNEMSDSDFKTMESDINHYSSHIFSDFSAYELLNNKIEKLTDFKKLCEFIFSNKLTSESIKNDFQTIYSIDSFSSFNNNEQTRLIETNYNSELGFTYLVGISDSNNYTEFISTISSLSRENIFYSSETVSFTKTVFLIFVVGDDLKQRILKIASISSVNIYDINKTDFRTEYKETKNILTETKEILNITFNSIGKNMKKILPSLRYWKSNLLAEKSILIEMNKFGPGMTNDILIAEGWVPENSKKIIKKVLQHLTVEEGEKKPWMVSELSSHDPPSYFPTNKFTQVYQDIVNAYGIPAHDELNPAAFSLFFFPFLAGIMFSDIFHGFILLLFAIFICKFEKKLSHWKKNEILKYPYMGRYFLLTMGVFSIFGGFIFNDFASMKIKLSNSSFNDKGNKIDSVYLFGLDHQWHGSINEASFSNSYKMKLSVLIGIFHMALGFFLDVLNCYYKRDYKNFYLQALPQAIGFMSSFGYMGFLILYKMFFSNKTDISIIKVFSAMAMFKSEYNRMFSENMERFIQTIMGLTSVFCFIVIAFGKATYHMYSEKVRSNQIVFKSKKNLKTKKNKSQSQISYRENSIYESDEQTLTLTKNDDEEENEENEGFFSILGMQLIHTLEFGISLISHVASYLRLWAINLCHCELTKILHEKILVPRLSGNIFILYIVGLIYGFFTLFFLILQGIFECFLHSLRLQWIEFQSKFFKGTGKLLKPFYIKTESDNSQENN